MDAGSASFDQIDRRTFLLTSGAWAAGAGLPGLSALSGFAQPAAVGSELPPWQPGLLDIHHIQTGRGNSALLIAPDGTSLLIDAGAAATQGPAMNPARPDAGKRPGQWIARYVERQLKSTQRKGLDYALLTHLHGDHVGEVSATSPESSYGDHKLTGISDVAELLAIGKIIDRGFPDYNYPAPVIDATALNYAQFARSAARRGVQVERARVGSISQVAQKVAAASYPQFQIRVIAGNGEAWTGKDETCRLLFPPQAGLKGEQLANENSCSLALRVSYGSFSYFTGGDLNCDTRYGRDPWRDIETPAARVAGPASVSTCNHHGYFDATGPEFVSAIRPRVWILQSWHASHPAISVLANLYSQVLYAGPRDVFCTGLHPAASLACGRFSDQFRSSEGHVVVRVPPGGAEFSVLVLEDADESNRVRAVFGPYPA